ncbi:DUF2164 domain-containing protein [Patescibacteria group bacterium]|nr:DUF2164 domain-containing protein [Patescibacteria group bacterium]
MKKQKRQWDLITEAKRETLLREIITFFKEERDEELGLIAAEEVLDFFLQNTALEIYGRGIADAQKLLRQHSTDLDIELDLLLNK